MFIADEIVEAGTLGGGGGENASQDVSLTSSLLEAFTQFLVQFSFVPPPEKRWRWSSGHLGDAPTRKETQRPGLGRESGVETKRGERGGEERQERGGRKGNRRGDGGADGDGDAMGRWRCGCRLRGWMGAGLRGPLGAQKIARNPDGERSRGWLSFFGGAVSSG